MFGRERRQRRVETADDRRRGLTPQQLATLATLESFRWTLTFVRRPLFRDPVPVVIDRSGERVAVIEADGRVEDNPGFSIRR